MSKYETTDKVWRTIQEADDHASVHNTSEFAEGYDTMPTFENPINRRSFMALLSASMAVTAASCRRPDHKLVPSVKGVEYITPGLPNYYATSYMFGNVAQNLLVKVREGRPIKVDGNDKDQMSMGKSNVWVQALLLNLYDPDRIRSTRISGGASTPKTAFETITKTIIEAKNNGKQVRILMSEHCSPSVSQMITEIETANPAVKFIVIPSVSSDNAAIANQTLLSINAEFVPDFSKAQVILSVDNDFLGTDKHSTYYTRGFSALRRPSKSNPVMNQLFVAESTYSLTGSNADKRIKLKPSDFEAFLATVHNIIAAKKGGSNVGSYQVVENDKATVVANALVSAGEKGAVVVGSHHSPKAHGIAIAINSMLGSIGSGKVFSKTVPNSESKSPAINQLRTDLRSGSVDTIVYIDVNTEHTADRDLKSLLFGVPNRFSITYFNDETAQTTTVNIPLAHQFESWGDTLSADGTRAISQPLIAPLNESSPSLGESIMAIGKGLDSNAFGGAATYFEYLKTRWVESLGSEELWTSALRDGVVLPPSTGDMSFSYSGASLETLSKSATSSASYSLYVSPSYAVYDGRFTNNGWLMECPDPITKHTWENIAMMSANTARQLDVKDNDVIVVKSAEGSVELPVLTQPGMQDGVVATTLGFGRTFGKVGANYGQNVVPMLPTGMTHGYVGITIEKSSKSKNVIARTQTYFHPQFEKEWDPKASDDKYRDIVRDMELSQLKAGKSIEKELEFPGEKTDSSRFKIPLSIVGGYEYKGHRWGMVIDMSACTGCNACVTACQSENNISVVGKEQVIRGREMHWIRLDRYYKGTPEEPVSMVEPMICQHCENAPCENVCPVAATTHSPEGLNEMTYNRCVGTRYCLNNCPYKVRRFNFLDYNKETREPLNYVYNPEVTVRMRGVMEKCTFCVQRINEAKYHAKDQGKSRVEDGTLQTACQQACPASAIYFGNTNDRESTVSKIRESERAFIVLEELNVRPSVTYLAKVYNTSTV